MSIDNVLFLKKSAKKEVPSEDVAEVVGWMNYYYCKTHGEKTSRIFLMNLYPLGSKSGEGMGSYLLHVLD